MLQVGCQPSVSMTWRSQSDSDCFELKCFSLRGILGLTHLIVHSKYEVELCVRTRHCENATWLEG